MKCGYSYEAMKAIFIAMLGREVDKEIITLDDAKNAISEFYKFCNLVANDKTLASELKEEGTKALQ